MGLLSSLLGFLGGCEDAPRTYAARVYVEGLREYVQYAAAAGPILTVVRGTPFGTSQAAIEAAVVEAIDGAPLVISPHFTADPAAAPRPDYRAVFVFDPPDGATARAACADRVRPEPADAASRAGVRVLAAFCGGERVLSEVTGEARSVSGLDHPDFRALLRQTVRDLLPARSQVGPN
jgi:hypothetical protein